MKEEDIGLSEESLQLLSNIRLYRRMVVSDKDSEPLRRFKLLSPAGEMHYYENGRVHYGAMWGVSSRGHRLLTLDDKNVKKCLTIWAKQDGLLDE